MRDVEGAAHAAGKTVRAASVAVRAAFVASLCVLSAFTASTATATDRVIAPERRYDRDLRAATDPSLQRALTYHIDRLKLTGAVNRKHLAVTLVDITDPASPRLAEVNGDEMMYAASLPKIAILFGAFHKIDAGKLKMTDHLRSQMTDMIRVSSNDAATYVLDRVGRDYLVKLLQAKPYAFYDTALNGGLWVGKAYARGVAYRRDPLHNISHGATAYQVARFYYMLETGRLVSPESSRAMKEMLGNPGINHKFVAGLRARYPDARIFRKSGSWGITHADSAIVEHRGRRYIAVGIAEDQKGGEWLKSLIVALDRIVISHQPVRTIHASLSDSTS